jgi:hypothetical protein
VEEALVLEEDPAEMASWSGRPDIKGSSEVVRMVLLCAVHAGITLVSPDLDSYDILSLT